MSKAFFRFLRGELNGFYVQNINQAWNDYTTDIKAFFTDFSKMQFEKGKIDKEYLYNLGTFAGIFLTRLSREENLTSLKMSESNIYNGEETSESGLFNLAYESFDYFPEVEGDINRLATSSSRSSLVGDEEPIGYISSEETDLFDDELNVRPSKILSVPPEGVAYSEFYGNQFMFLSEASISYEKISPDLYLDLFKTIQWIKYNGTSLASLVKLVELICPNGLVQVASVEASENGRNIEVTYIYNEEVTIDWKLQRRYLLEYIVGLKMPQVKLSEQV